MPPAVGSQLNKVASAIVTPAEVAAGLSYAAINLDATYGNGYSVEGMDFAVTVFNLADIANIFRITMFIFKNTQFDPALPLSVNAAGGEQLFSITGPDPLDRAVERLFIPAFQLVSGARYSIAADFGMSPAPAGNLVMTIVATGRPTPGNAAPIVLR